MTAKPTSGTTDLLNTTPGPQKTKPSHPRRIIVEDIRNHSTAEISRGLYLDRSLLLFALKTAVYRNSVPMTAYLLTTEHAPVKDLSSVWIPPCPWIALLETLVSAGWDVNQRSSCSGIENGLRLLNVVIWNEALVKWCIEHGAHVTFEDEDQDTIYNNPPLTEEAAFKGIVTCFKLIRENGASNGRRTLHRAAESTAICAAALKPERMAILRYLVEDEHLDVNLIDTDEQLPNHFGTPIAYAAMGRGGLDAVWYLLSKGADPTVKDCWGGQNALNLAMFSGNEDVVRVLKEWVRTRELIQKKGSKNSVVHIPFTPTVLPKLRSMT